MVLIQCVIPIRVLSLSDVTREGHGLPDEKSGPVRLHGQHWWPAEGRGGEATDESTGAKRIWTLPYLEDVRSEGTSSALKRSRPLPNRSGSTSGVSNSHSDTYKEAPAGAEKTVPVFAAGAESPQKQKEAKKSTSDMTLGTVGENKLCGGAIFFFFSTSSLSQCFLPVSTKT